MKFALTGVRLANDEIGVGVCSGTGQNSCVSAYLRICVSTYAYAYAYVYAAARMHKKTRGLDRAFFCLETD